MPRQITRTETKVQFLWGFIPYPTRVEVSYWKYEPQRTVWTYRWFQNDWVKIYEGGKVYEGDAGRITLFVWGQKIEGIEVVEHTEPPAPQAAAYYAMAPPPQHTEEPKSIYEFKNPLPIKSGVSYVPA